MTNTAAVPRDALSAIHRALAMIAGGLWLAAVALRGVGIAPMLATAPLPEGVVAAVCVLELLVGWYWIRRRVPRRRKGTAIAGYWNDPSVGRAIVFALFVFESGTVFAIVWSILAGSWLSVGVGLMGFASLLFSRPTRFEES